MRVPCQPPPSRRRAGFSLIELLVASVAASILALTASTLLVLAWRSWQTLREGIEMQRDASTALIAMKHHLREATTNGITTTNGTLNINTMSFSQQGSDLVFDPDTSVAHDEIAIIEGQVDEFTPSQTNQSGRVTVTIELRLFGDIGHESTVVFSTVSLRN